MPLYGGIDLHANNSVVVLLNEPDQVIYRCSGAPFNGANACPKGVTFEQRRED